MSNKRKQSGSSRQYRQSVGCPVTFQVHLNSENGNSNAPAQTLRGILLKDESIDPETPAVRVAHEDGLARLWKYSEISNMKAVAGKLRDEQRKLTEKQHRFHGGSPKGRQMFYDNQLEGERVEVRCALLAWLECAPVRMRACSVLSHPAAVIHCVLCANF